MGIYKHFEQLSFAASQEPHWEDFLFMLLKKQRFQTRILSRLLQFRPDSVRY